LQMADNFHDRDGVIWMDGKMVPWREANIHVLTHGLHYASSVFEGERLYKGHIFKLRPHTDRLLKSAEIMDFKIPYTADEIDAATKAVVKAMNLTDGYIRPVAWRGSEQMGVSAPNAKIHLAIAAWEWPSYFSPEARAKGIKMVTGPYRRPPAECAPVHAKAAGLYMICTLSKQYADARGAQDAMMLDYRGFVAEGTGANFFLVKDGKLHTPAPDCFLNGITRQTVISLAKKRGIDVVERFIKPEELAEGGEVFVTGTAAELTPVGQIDDYRFTPGQITQTLLSDYETLTRSGQDE